VTTKEKEEEEEELTCSDEEFSSLCGNGDLTTLGR